MKRAGLCGHIVGHCDGHECHMAYPVAPQHHEAEDPHLMHTFLSMTENQDLENESQTRHESHQTHVLYHWICLCFQLVYHLPPDHPPIVCL